MSNVPSVRVIRLEGELDIARRSELARMLVVDGAEPAILLDFEHVTYADSTAIAEMLRFRNEAERAGRRIAVLIGDAHFRRVLQYAGLSQAFALFDDRGIALTHLTRPQSP